MKKSLLAFAAAAFAALAAQPSDATTFPTLTRIYVASGVVDTITSGLGGVGTVVHCSNMSGQTASVRFVFRYDTGQIASSGTLLVGNLASRAAATSGGVDYIHQTSFPSALMYGGTVEILSTESAVFCSAMQVDTEALAGGPAGIALHMVRFNPHPGAVE